MEGKTQENRKKGWLTGEILKINFSEMERMMQSGKRIQSVELEKKR